MTRRRASQAEEEGDRAARREVPADLLATAVLRLIQEGWHPAPAGPAAEAAPRSIALLSPPLRASMSIAGGAQKPPAKEDEHG